MTCAHHAVAFCNVAEAVNVTSVAIWICFNCPDPLKTGDLVADVFD